MSVWVVVASRYGSSREVADAIAEELRHAAEVEVRDAADVTDFEGADAVVLGSATYGGHWLEPARRLVEERAELAARPTWLSQRRPDRRPVQAGEGQSGGHLRRARDDQRRRTRWSPGGSTRHPPVPGSP
jgi:menaquinone-dependent protoporphyrinogen oxidase